MQNCSNTNILLEKVVILISLPELLSTFDSILMMAKGEITLL